MATSLILPALTAKAIWEGGSQKKPYLRDLPEKSRFAVSAGSNVLKSTAVWLYLQTNGQI